MTATPKSKSQIEKFKQAARQLETDDNEKRFNEKLGKIAKAKPKRATPKARHTGRSNKPRR